MSKEIDTDYPNILIGSFSTNKVKKTSLSLLKIFTEAAECSNIIIKKNEKIEFNHKILNSNGDKFECKITFLEINLTSKNTKVHNLIDSYIIFFDLENKESLIELEKILLYLNAININGKKIYLINFYMNKKNIRNNLTEDNIKLYFENNELDNYDISLINLEDSNDELVEIISSISVETLEDKNLIIDNIIINRKNQNFDENKSTSKCLIY